MFIRRSTTRPQSVPRQDDDDDDGKMMMMMMAVLEDISLWTYVHTAHATRQTLLHALVRRVGCSRVASIDARQPPDP